jgi:predicted RNA-binding protein YlqC (UPF0109 family)
MNCLLRIALGLCLLPGLALAEPAPVAPTTPGSSSTVATGLANALVKALVSHRDELAVVSERQARAATHGVIEAGTAELGRAIEEDFATHGRLSQAIANATTISVRDAIQTSSRQLQLVITDACGFTPLGDCIRAEARVMSREMSAGAMDEFRWPARLLVTSVSVFAIIGSVLMLVILRRLCAAPRTRSLLEIVAPPS